MEYIIIIYVNNNINLIDVQRKHAANKSERLTFKGTMAKWTKQNQTHKSTVRTRKNKTK